MTPLSRRAYTGPRRNSSDERTRAKHGRNIAQARYGVGVTSLPQEFDLIVVGGGPAGSAAAAVAARGGARVLLLEAAAHPRPKVGESLLPGIVPVLEAMGCLAEVEAAGFQAKTGATHWGFGPRPWDLWLRDTDEFEGSWFVDRARFDALLFDAARSAGAVVRENAPARAAIEDKGRVVGVRFRGGEARARFVLDASGSAAKIAGPRSERSTIEGLRHRAHYAYWKSKGRLPAPRQEQGLFLGLETAWAWCFPVEEDVRSVGLVELEDSPPLDYESTVRASALAAILGEDAELLGAVQHARDWSYRCAPVTGAGWFAAGDAAGFIDPVLSTGVLLAMHSGWHVARCVLQVLGGELREEDATKNYAEHHSEMFGDLLRIVRFYYQQNQDRDAVFWESKRILTEHFELKPQKAFLILTSGLVRNLAFRESKTRVTESRLASALGEASTLDTHDPEELSFVCVHLEHQPSDDAAAQLYLLIEARDSAAPSLFRTKSYDINCLAPRYNNDPISVPSLEAPLRALHEKLSATDEGATLGEWWRTSRTKVAAALDELPPTIEVRRVFGE